MAAPMTALAAAGPFSASTKLDVEAAEGECKPWS